MTIASTTGRFGGGATTITRSVALPYAAEGKLALWYFVVAILAFAVGGLFGTFQSLNYAGFDRAIGFDAYSDVPFIASYYQGLTFHGVLLVLVWTTFFISGFLTYVAVHALQRPLVTMTLGWAGFWVQTVGVLLAAVPLFMNDATVLFTFYPPLRANPLFYLGLTLVVVGTWIVFATILMTYLGWRKDNPGVRTPLPAFMALITFAMWTIASVGIAGEVLLLVLPWSLGLIPGTDALLARTLFWFTGHPIVYFWLLPVYVSWYTMVPKQAGGKLFSDPMARVSFILFLILSIPVGMHHQYADPGVQQTMKFVHAVLTFGVFFPSLLTFFNVVASLENAGRARGGTGWLSWIGKLPWSNAVVTTQVLAMLLFAAGGIGGLVNASYNVNNVVHNTAWITGHFHLTVGSGVTLSFMGMLYWLIPHLTGRKLWNNGMALTQAVTWFVGMIIFSNTLHRLGLMGMPRRSNIGQAPYLASQGEWTAILPLVGIGGILMTVSALLFFIVLLMTAFRGERMTTAPEYPQAQALSGPNEAPAILDRWRPWLAIAFVLILLAYVPPLAAQLGSVQLNAPGFRPW